MDLIDRQAAIDAVKTIREEIWGVDIPSPGDCLEYVEHHEQMKRLMHTCDNLIKEIEKQTTAERTGRWTKKEVSSERVEEWQAAKCSACGRWHTTPYAYYFSHHNYCPHCGARMERE